jgi:D-3-phosphoglycerate dehydrogenase/C-terminal binding protein
MNTNIIITDFITPGDTVAEQNILDGVGTVTAIDGKSEADLMGHIEDADAIMIYHLIGMSRDAIARLKRCKVIARCGVGYDHVDHAFARKCGIPVVNVPDYGTEEVADSAITLMLSLTRGTHLLDSRMRGRRGEWTYTHAKPVFRLRGRVCGIIGLGRIGIAAALRAKALGMDVMFYDPYKSDGYDKALGLRRAESLEKLLAQSFVVSLHAPLTEETRMMMSHDAIMQMPRGSYLINTARGAMVDTKVLPELLAEGHLAGAGIDVLEVEPPSDDHPLLKAWRDPKHPAYDKLMINPHSAFYCEEGLVEVREKGAEACRRAILGLPLRNVVN